MSRVIIDDLWLKSDGEVSPSPNVKRSLASAKDPFKATYPSGGEQPGTVKETVAVPPVHGRLGRNEEAEVKGIRQAQ